MATPLHLIGGFLGAGKTSAVRALLTACPGERIALIVNDFGEAAIDAARLDGPPDGSEIAAPTAVRNIAAGCVCCTAPSGLAAAVLTLLDEVKPDRIFIEPSGLARPQDIIDTLRRGPVGARVTLGPTLVLADPAATTADPALQGEQLEAADILVINRVDLADPGDLEAFRARVRTLWPAPLAVIETTFGRIPATVLRWPPGAGPRADEQPDPSEPVAPEHTRHDHASHGHAHPSTDGYVARSWMRPPAVAYAWDALRATIEATPGIVRLKGMFHTDVGWMNIDLAGVSRKVQGEPTAWRRDNRADAIGRTEANLAALERAIDATRTTQVAAAGAIQLVGPDGGVQTLTRAELNLLGEQVPDIGALVPGRRGSGVWLRDVLAPWRATPDARFVVVAADGLTTEPVAVDAAGDAVLVHALGDGPLPPDQGGPYRILVPAGAGRTACANVKDVVRIRILADG